MTKKSVTEIVGILVSELTPLTSEERVRVVQASLMLLGEAPIKTTDTRQQDESGNAGGLPMRARTWMKQYRLSLEQIHEVFHVSGEGVEVIAAAIPGKNNREKVRNAYVLCGVTELLASGDAKFDDKTARLLCEVSGFYDQTNHVKYMKGGNEFTGSKDKGWTLTAPGLKHAAILISELGRA